MDLVQSIRPAGMLISGDKAARILSFPTLSDFASRLAMSDSRNELLFGNRES